MNAAEAPLGTQFTPQQKVELSSGKPLVIEENVPGEAWPLLTICQQSFIMRQVKRAKHHHAARA